MSRGALTSVSVAIAVAALSAQTQGPRPPTGTGLIVGQVVNATTGRGVANVAVTLVPSQNVRPGGSFANPRGIITDAEGRFVLRSLPAGAYQLTARRSGYSESFFGAVTPGGEGRSIVLDEGGRAGDATIRLWKLAVIGGTIVDEAGEPIIGLQVRALKRSLTAGRWKFGDYYSTIRYGSHTDDRGMYRIADLEPGEYIVSVPLTSAVAPASAVAALEALRTDPAARAAYTATSEAFMAGGAPTAGPGSARTLAVGDFVQALTTPGLAPVSRVNGSVLMYQTEFYPGVTSAASAQAVTVGAGEERGGLDFAMAPVPTMRVSGMVSGSAGPSAGLTLRLVQSDGDTLLQETQVATTVSDASGAFTFLGVPPGRYIVRVMSMPRLPQVMTQVGAVMRMEQGAGSSSEPTLWADVPVSVANVDTTGVAVSLSTGVRASGHVVFDATSTKPDPAQLAGSVITFELADGRPPLRYGDDRTRLTGDTFTTPELPPGKYLVRMDPRGPWTMKSAMAGPRDISDVPLVVDGRELPPITITVTDKPGTSLGGTVRGLTNASADATVFLFPVERDAWVDYGSFPRRLRRARVAKSGMYVVVAVPPGEYYVVALAEDRAADWRDPKVLDALAGVATRVTIAEDEAKTLDLKVERAPVVGVEREVAPTESEVRAVPDLAARPSESTSGPFVTDQGTEWPQQPVRDAPRPLPEPTGTSAISGVVVSDDATPSPVRRVVVTLNCPEPKVGRTAVTDDGGRFAFDALPGGRYTLTATKPGYIDSRYGATRPGRPGTPITVAADARSSVTMKIMRGAVITGVIRDALGDPMRGVSVNASRFEFNNGEQQLSTAGRSQDPSDDRGQYRIYGLAPGEYFVSIERPNVGDYQSLRQTTAADVAAAQRDLRANGAGVSVTPPPVVAPPTPEPDMGYAAVFYPGTPRFSQAIAVTVSAGEERSGVDITVQLTALAQIRAKVVGPDGQVPAMVQAILVALTPMPGFSGAGLNAGMRVPVTDGNVLIFGVPPGEYTLHVGGSTMPPPPPANVGAISFSTSSALNLPFWAMVPLTIDGHDIDGLSVTLEAAKSVKGRVVFEGATPPPNLSTVQIWLRGPQRGGVTLGGVSKRATATPEFTLDGVVPASYTVVAQGVRGWMVKAAIVNGRDAADLPVEINADVAAAVVTFTDRLTELSGVLQTPAGTPAPSYYVIVFPKDPAYWLHDSRRIVSLRPATDGHFTTTPTNPLPPGDYLIAAVTDVRSGEWFDPTFLKMLAPTAIPVTIGEGEKRKQDIQIR